MMYIVPTGQWWGYRYRWRVFHDQGSLAAHHAVGGPAGEYAHSAWDSPFSVGKTQMYTIASMSARRQKP